MASRPLATGTTYAGNEVRVLASFTDISVILAMTLNRALGSLPWPRSIGQCQRQPSGQCPWRRWIANTGKRTSKPWTTAEEEQVLKLRSEGKSLEQIADHVSGRTRAAIAMRIYQSLRVSADEQGLIKAHSKFSKKEDVLLQKLRDEKRTWHVIASKFPNRTVEDLRLRHRTLLDQRERSYTGRATTWTSSEDDLILHLRQERKLSWPTIAAQLPGRTPGTALYRFKNLLWHKTRPKTEQKVILSPAEMEELIACRGSGMSWAKIAEKLGRSATLLSRRYSRYKAGEDSSG